MPKPWTPAGTNNSIIGSGAGRGENNLPRATARQTTSGRGRSTGRCKSGSTCIRSGPRWRHVGVVRARVGTAGANTRFAKLTGTRRRRTGSGRADYVVVEPDTGAVAAWLNGCEDGV
ncbi:hypothetical protein MY11210_008947 [Beauveria gryllotalpidicola]